MTGRWPRAFRGANRSPKPGEGLVRCGRERLVEGHRAAVDDGPAEGEGAQAPGDVDLAGVLGDEGLAGGVGVGERPGLEGGDGADRAGVDDHGPVLDRDGTGRVGVGVDQRDDLLGGRPGGRVGRQARAHDALGDGGEADVQLLPRARGGLQQDRGGADLGDLGARDGGQTLLTGGALGKLRGVGDEELAGDQRRAVRHSLLLPIEGMDGSRAWGGATFISLSTNPTNCDRGR